MFRSRTAIEYSFGAFLLLQIVLWSQLKAFKPDMSVLPDLPSEAAIQATSFGDEQFYFRTLAFQIQFAGDTYGRVTPLRDYDYEKLREWFSLLDTLDSASNFVPSMAAYYYSNTQYTPDVRYIVDYLEEHADRDPYHKWWWYAQAVYNANHKLQNRERALEIAYKLAAVNRKDIPIWARQMPAFILEDLGEKEEALLLANEIVESEDLTEAEMNFMWYFIKERLEKMKADEAGHDYNHGHDHDHGRE